MRGGTSCCKLNVWYDEVQSCHFICIISSPVSCFAVIAPIVLPLLLGIILGIFLGSDVAGGVIGNIPNVKDLGADSAYDGSGSDADDCAAGGVR